MGWGGTGASCGCMSRRAASAEREGGPGQRRPAQAGDEAPAALGWPQKKAFHNFTVAAVSGVGEGDIVSELPGN